MADTDKVLRSDEQRRYFLDAVRQARQNLLRDAEGGDQVIFVLEKLGSYCCGCQADLAGYSGLLVRLAQDSHYASDVPKAWPHLHAKFSRILDALIEARNDAMHQGVGARRLGAFAVRIALTLEDALMANGLKIGDIMVRNPVAADMWQPISYVREVMLAEAFSFLPVCDGGEWKVVADYSIAQFLKRPDIQLGRKDRLVMSLNDAIKRGCITLIEPIRCAATTPSSEVGTKLQGLPVLVLESGVEAGEERLIGILTAFDLL